MNISSLSLAMSTSNVNSDIGMAVLSKNLESFKEAGSDMVKMMETSVYPNLGQNIDYSV